MMCDRENAVYGSAVRMSQLICRIMCGFGVLPCANYWFLSIPHETAVTSSVCPNNVKLDITLGSYNGGHMLNSSLNSIIH